MNIFIAVLTDLCHFLKIIMAMNLFGNFNKSNSKYNKILIIGIIAMSSNIIFFDTNMVIDLIVYFVTTYVVFRICYVENKRVLLLFSIWIPFMMSMIDTMFLILVKILFRLLSVSLKSVEEFMASILSLIFMYVLGNIYRKHYKYGLKKIEYKNLLLLTALIVVNTVVVLVVAKVATEELTGKHKLLYSGAFIAVIVGVFIQLGAVILLKVSNNISREKELEAKIYLKEQQQYYEYLERRERNTKKFRHDVRNHLELLTEFIAKKQYKEVDEYLERINIKIDELGNAISLGNGIAEAIVNKYYYQALNLGINMKVSGAFPTECRIDAFDLCTIFSNILSNALEAASESEKKMVYLDCRYNDKNIIINIRNTYKDQGQFKDNYFVTTKSNREYHGFGLENVKECIERNNGLIDIEVEKEEFIETISIKK
ncbi:GHKL domain-containing protein [Eubacterium sp.]